MEEKKHVARKFNPEQQQPSKMCPHVTYAAIDGYKWHKMEICDLQNRCDADTKKKYHCPFIVWKVK